MAWRTMRSCVVANKLRVRGRVVVAYKQYRYVVNQRLKCDANLGQLGTRVAAKSGSRSTKNGPSPEVRKLTKF